MTTYYFNVTDIVRSVAAQKTVLGIQRAATMIIRHAAPILGAGNIRLAYYDDRKQCFLTIPADRFLALESFETHEMAAALSLSVPVAARRRANHALLKYRPGSLKYHFHKLRIDLEAARGNEVFFRKRGFTPEEWNAWRKAPAAQRQNDAARPLDELVKEGDVFCILGGFWDNVAQEEAFTALKAQGVRVHLLIHDLIPLLMPEAVRLNPVVFHDRLKASAGYVSGYLANSECTARDLQVFLGQTGSRLPVRVTPLAQAGLPHSASPVALHSDDVVFDLETLKRRWRRSETLRDVTKLPFALCVGTIEARKNCWRLAQAWIQLSREPGLELPRLVFAGGRGWLNDDFLAAYDATSGWGGWVRLAEEPSDEDLEYLYRTCRFTVTASLYEGWGLPIGEGLSYGKTGVVANVSSMPEVGGDMVEYCNPHSIPSIASACRKLVADPDHRAALEARITGTRLRGWDDVGRDVAAALQGEMGA